jgi:hypothetical protein
MLRHRAVRASVLVVGVGALLAIAAPAWAQASAAERRWEIEGHGGLMRRVGSPDGDAVLPPAGPPVATSSPIFPSRRVSSWFFGDGADLLNLVNEQFGVSAALRPLDEALGRAGVETGNVFAGGARVRRRLTPRYDAEFSLDVIVGATEPSGEFLAAVDATRDSFVPAFDGLLATGPFTDVVVTAEAASRGGSTREVALTAAAVYRFGEAGGIVPYVTLGGGVIAGTGDAATISLEGRYRFLVLGEVPIDETDRVAIRHETRTAFAGVVGAGVRRDLSDRVGLRLDGRVFIGPSTTRVVIDADPVVATGAPTDFVESFTTPAIQFSNAPPGGRESTLGGPPLRDFETFAGDGWQTRVLITAGVFVRF